MHCLRCGICCRETEMLLSKKDIERLEKKGYTRNFFVSFDTKGYAKLRNHRGYCVFYDAEKNRCRVRFDRPLGCRIYPVIYDETNGLTVDIICPNRKTLTDKQQVKRGKKVLQLLKTIDTEAKQRRLAKSILRHKNAYFNDNPRKFPSISF